MNQYAPRPQGHTPAAPASAAWLQRKCACGNTPQGAEAECESCREEKALGLQTKLAVGARNDPLEHEADRAAAQVMNQASVPATTPAQPRLSRRARGQGAPQPVPASVTATLNATGSPLPPSARAFFEPRFGHDFGHVRVHHDAPAAASARDVSAHAYTVGHHVVFDQGRYAPHTGAGKALLAHELAHVVQQTGQLQRSAAAPELETRANRSEDEDEEARRENAPMSASEDHDEGEGHFGGPMSERFPPPIDSAIEGAPLPTGWDREALETERACLATAAPDPLECDPARALTWADFSGRAPRRSRFGAMTFSGLRERAINSALARCAPYTEPPTRGVQAFFTPGRSWVKAEFANAADPAQNGCNQIVGRCQTFFDREARAGRSGATWGLSPRPPRGCAASTPARGDQATTRDECATVVAQDCQDTRVTESARLLQHEQTHFNLSCAMARKANAMILADPAINFTQLLRNARQVLSRQQRLYDRETSHGCNAGAQARWEADIAAGLPRVNIPAPRRRGGRGRRGRRR